VICGLKRGEFVKMKYAEYLNHIFIFLLVGFFAVMCVPPSDGPTKEDVAEQKRLDSLRQTKCPRLMSSAAEYYRNRDWQKTVDIYKEITSLGCDDFDAVLAPPEEIYQYYAIAYERLAKFDSSEYVLLKGLQKIPENVDLRKRLAYAYKKQGLVDKQIIEYERLLDAVPDDTEIMLDLALLYKGERRYEDQVYILEKLLKVDPTNENALADLANAYVKVDKDPLDIYMSKYRNNPTASNGIQLSDQLINKNRIPEAIDILKSVIRNESTNKPAHRKLGEAYHLNDQLEEASQAYEELFKLDPRGFQIASRIAEVNIELEDFGKALRWAEKAIQVSNSSGESLGLKGNVYYKSFQVCRTGDISSDDRVVSSLAMKYFLLAEEKGNRRFNRYKNWLLESEVLFTKANWFMLDADVKSRGYVQPKSSCYQWIEERLEKDASW
jgi:tetratricopeptide (TPR) repeat protein